MSPNGQTPLVLRSLALDLPAGYRLAAHRHDWPQLVHGRRGVLTVEAEGGTWVVPPGRAVWIPAGIEHSLRTTGSVELRTLYLQPDAETGFDPRCRVLTVSPLLRELIDHAVALGPLTQRDHGPLIELTLERLRASIEAPLVALELAWPTDARGRRLAEVLAARLDSDATLEHLARGTGAGLRTHERIFQRETGSSVGRWRQQLRLLRALEQLATGDPVTQVALAVGYQSASAFVAAFRRTLGTTPGRFFAD